MRADSLTTSASVVMAAVTKDPSGALLANKRPPSDSTCERIVCRLIKEESDSDEQQALKQYLQRLGKAANRGDGQPSQGRGRRARGGSRRSIGCNRGHRRRFCGGGLGKEARGFLASLAKLLRGDDEWGVLFFEGGFLPSARGAA
jgi:hypothetical protein